jgi:hypothetical protein
MAVYLLLQDIRWAFIIIYLFESLEVLVLAICSGTYCWWNGGPLDCPSLVTDNFIGDIVQGSIGIFLGVLLRVTLRTPNWSLSLREAYERQESVLFAKRLVLGVLILACPVLATLETENGMDFGVPLYGGVLCALIALLALLCNTAYERKRFWTDERGAYDKIGYESFFACWIAISAALVFGGRYIPYPSTYARVYTVWGGVWFALILFAFNRGLWEQLMDLHSFGFYSTQRVRKESRFLYDQRRYRSESTKG